MEAWRWLRQLPASPPSDLRRLLLQISGASRSRSPSAQATMEEAANPPLSSSEGPAFPPHLRRLLHQFSGASSRSPSVGWWQRSAAWIARFIPLPGPARSKSNRLGSGRDRQLGRTAKRRHRPATKRHLYVVLDDHHENGFAIHKLDIDDDLDGDSGSTGTLRCLSEPVVRIGLPITIGSKAQFTALGDSIIATCGFRSHQNPSIKGGVTVVYDTKTAALTVSGLLPEGLRYGFDSAVAVGNRLYVLESYTDYAFSLPYFPGGLHCLQTGDRPDDDKRWDWRPLPNSSRFFWSWNSSPPELPFDAQSITAHAVHPRGRTIFVSACGWQVDRGTFSYGTASGKWTCRGDWVLPFKGPAHYDGELDAWVGLHLPCDTDFHPRPDGYLCASRVTSARASSQPPEWKVSIEKLFWEDPDWRLVNVQLVYMAECSKYCLLEHLRLEGAVKEKYVLRLTMFRVNYSKDGELTTTAHWPARSYEMPNYNERFDAQAFWM